MTDNRKVPLECISKNWFSIRVLYRMYLIVSDQQIAQEQVLEILPMVSEVNAVSEELNKQKSFEVVLISAAAQESTYGTLNSTS